MASNKLRSIRHLLAAAALSVTCFAAVPGHAQVSGLEIVAPASPGGGELMAQILGGHISVAMGGYNEFAPQIKDGKLRALALSAPERLPEVATPTLKEQDVNLEFITWRGVFAKPDLKAAEKKQLEDMVTAVVASDEWKETLRQRGWLDLYQPAGEFDAYLKSEQLRVKATLEDIGLVK